MRLRRSRPVPVVPSSAFKGFRFPPEIIVLAVRWYLRYGLSYRDVEELLGERGIKVDHVRCCCVDSGRAAVNRIPVAFRVQIVRVRSVNACSIRRWDRTSIPSS